jgi:membrane protein DedA with SNARE-associated domain
VTSFLAQHGVWAVFLLMALDALFPAFSELVMVYGGALASGALAHDLEVFGTPASGFDAYLAIALAGTIGYLFGALVGWGIGHYGGRPFLERRGRLFHLDEARLDRAEQWFERWGDSTAFVGRLTPGVRSFVSIPAGVFESPIGRYNVLTLVGNGIWCLALAGIGWALGSNWHRFDHAFRYVEIVVLVGILVAVAYWIWRRRRPGTLRSHDDSSR